MEEQAFHLNGRRKPRANLPGRNAPFLMGRDGTRPILPLDTVAIE